MKFLNSLGKYLLLIGRVFSYPEHVRLYYKKMIEEFMKLGVSSVNITLIISVFMGAVITLQTANNMDSALLPKYLIGLATRESILLEFSSTMLALILAGKIGSNIATEIGSMRISEQIDALEMMGINSASYLILPKIVASILFFPLLTILSMGIGIIGGYLVVAIPLTDVINVEEYVSGIRTAFNPFFVTYSIIKSVFFAFIISSISSYKGYYAHGSSLDVGHSATSSVVNSSIAILVFNLILTHILLT